jgi:hypothetical protein
VINLLTAVLRVELGRIAPTSGGACTRDQGVRLLFLSIGVFAKFLLNQRPLTGLMVRCVIIRGDARVLASMIGLGLRRYHHALN